MDKPKYYLQVNLPPNFDEADADTIRADIMSFLNSKNQYGALYGPKSSKKGITIDKVSWRTNEN
jgi:hypothetical protein